MFASVRDMSKSTRLPRLLQAMRLRTPPILAADLAEEMGVSLRTLYRDIDDLRSAGAVIDGEAGFGYTLTEDPALPPMMFTKEEIEALVLGLGEVIEVGDPALAQAAKEARAKLKATLPDRMSRYLENAVLHAHKFRPRPEISIDPALIRQAAWEEMAIDIGYRDVNGAATERRVLPLQIMYFDDTLALMAFCLLRDAPRVFRLDRIETVKCTQQSFRPRRVALLRDMLKGIKAKEAAGGFPMPTITDKTLT